MWGKLVFFLFMLQVKGSINFNTGFFLGSVTGKTFYLDGDELNLMCKIENPTSFTARDIKFNFSKPLSAQFVNRCIPSNHIHVVNESVATLTLPNVNVSDAGQYMCYVGTVGCHSDTDMEIVAIAEDVIIEYRPRKVTDFRCEVKNWDESMTVSWRHPVLYVNESNIHVSLDYFSDSYGNKVFSCPDLTFDRCLWNGKETFDLSPNLTVEINVTIDNIGADVRSVASGIYTVDPTQHVKPAPIQGLKVTPDPDREGCLILSWTHEKVHRAKIYRVWHQKVGDKTFTELRADLTETSYSHCGYAPMTQYNFSVDCYPAKPNSGYWSNPAFFVVETPQTRPSLGPEVTNGSYVTNECVRRVRNVTLMWKDVKQSARNGIIEGYDIFIDEKEIQQEKQGSYSVTVPLPCDAQTVVKIFSHNKAGMSLESSVMVIAPGNVQVPDVVAKSFSIEMQKMPNPTNENLRAVWDVDEGAKHFIYSVFWCRAGQPKAGQQCQGPISWVEGNSPPQSMLAIPPLEASTRSFVFGISARDPQTGLSSGILFTSCIYDRDADSIPPPSKLALKPSVSGIDVIWDKVLCSINTLVKVSYYTLKYCEADKCNDTNNIETLRLEPSISFYTLSNLEPVKYVVFMQSHAENISSKEVREEATPLEPDGDNIKIYFIIGVTVAIVLGVIITLLIYLCRKSRRRAMRLQSIKLLLNDPIARPGPPVSLNNHPSEHRSRQNFPSNSGTNLMSAIITGVDNARPMDSGMEADDSGTPITSRGTNDNSRSWLIGEKDNMAICFSKAQRPTRRSSRTKDAVAAPSRYNLLNEEDSSTGQTCVTFIPSPCQTPMSQRQGIATELPEPHADAAGLPADTNDDPNIVAGSSTESTTDSCESYSKIKESSHGYYAQSPPQQTLDAHSTVAHTVVDGPLLTPSPLGTDQIVMTAQDQRSLVSPKRSRPSVSESSEVDHYSTLTTKDVELAVTPSSSAVLGHGTGLTEQSKGFAPSQTLVTQPLVTQPLEQFTNPSCGQELGRHTNGEENGRRPSSSQRLVTQPVEQSTISAAPRQEVGVPSFCAERPTTSTPAPAYPAPQQVATPSDYVPLPSNRSAAAQDLHDRTDQPSVSSLADHRPPLGHSDDTACSWTNIDSDQRSKTDDTSDRSRYPGDGLDPSYEEDTTGIEARSGGTAVAGTDPDSVPVSIARSMSSAPDYVPIPVTTAVGAGRVLDSISSHGMVPRNSVSTTSDFVPTFLASSPASVPVSITAHRLGPGNSVSSTSDYVPNTTAAGPSNAPATTAAGPGSFPAPRGP